MKQNNTGSILLTSTGLSSESAQSYTQSVDDLSLQVVSIVVTASEGKKENKYVQLALKQFSMLGVKTINLIDLELGEIAPDDTTILYVAGGNTFKLMYFARKTNFAGTIQDLLNRNGIYIGVSAGAIIVGNSIEGALIEGDENLVQMEDFNGFNLVDYAIFPHSDDSIKTKALEMNIFKNPLFIDNQQAFLIEIKDKQILNPRFV